MTHCDVIAALSDQFPIKVRIDARDRYSECIGFTSDEIDEFILALCTG